VFLCYASDKGAALVDRELYLPEEWATDVERRRAAAVPGETKFATELELARRMIERALKAGAPCSWIAADEVYGNNSNCASGWKRDGWVMCWPSLQTSECVGPIMIGDAWMRSHRACRIRPGSAFPQGRRAAKANGSTTGL
jgi:hypothetical protein